MENLKGKTLGILLTKGPETSDLHMALRIAQCALRKGIAVKIFLMIDGLYAVLHPQVQELKNSGAEIILCRYGADRRGIKKELFGNVRSGSQYDLSHMLAECDRFLSFT